MLNEEAVREALSKVMACNCHPIYQLGELVKDKYADHVEQFLDSYYWFITEKAEEEMDAPDA